MTVEEFWRECREALPGLPEDMPEAWAFGALPEHADELLALVLAGTKTATASSLWDIEATGEAMPRPGDLSIILDGSGTPRALIETTAGAIVPFDEVSQEHAFAEGENDRTLDSWREIHERYWRRHSESPRGFERGMPVVCEEFRLLHSSFNGSPLSC